MSASGAPPSPMSRTSVASWPKDRISGTVPRGIDASTRKCTAAYPSKRVELLAVRQFTGERQRGPDIVSRDGVFPLDLFKAHPAGQATHDDRDRRTRSADHGLAVANLRIDHDALVHDMGLLGPPRSSYRHPRYSESALGRLAAAQPGEGEELGCASLEM